MIITVKEETMVTPAKATPVRSLWNSSLDLIMPRVHTPTIYLYRPNGSPNFFEPQLLKDALAKALVPFYPMAGRICLDVDSRVEINCTCQGALFVAAETCSVLDDLGDFAPTTELKLLIPSVDYSQDISSYPLHVQVHTSILVLVRTRSFSVIQNFHTKKRYLVGFNVH